MIPLPALLAEIRAAGEPPATIGPRLSPEHIKHILRSGVYVGGGWAPAADCAIRQLRADLARLAAEVERRQWQPIETAPKDGTAVWVSVDGQPCIGYWDPDDAFSQPKWFVKSSFRRRGDGDLSLTDSVFGTYAFGVEPTHWMPLPEPPERPKNTLDISDITHQ